MPRLLVHIATGSENPTRVTLGFLIARTAVAQGHDVDVFLAGDAVNLLRDETLDALHGVGTGSLREHYQALSDGGARFYASAMSSRARGLAADHLGGREVTFARPDQLVELIFEADRVISY